VPAFLRRKRNVLLCATVGFSWKDAMKRFAGVLALSFLFAQVGMLSAAAQPFGGNQPARDYISNVRIGGWIGNDALLVLPDRSAGAAAVGGGFGPVKLLEIGDNSFTVDYSGVKGKVTLDPVWQLAAHPDLTNWLISFLKGVQARIDAQTPDITQEEVIRIANNGAVTSHFLKVQQASPFQCLPDWMESIRLKVTINPHDPTGVALMSMTITPLAQSKLLKPMYATPEAKTEAKTEAKNEAKPAK
jgi:hypothetical protein